MRKQHWSAQVLRYRAQYFRYLFRAASSRWSAGQKLATVSHSLTMVDKKGKGVSGIEIDRPQGKREEEG